VHSTDIFRYVFQQLFFPYLAADLGRLGEALQKGDETSCIALPIEADADKRAALAASLHGLLRDLNVPAAIIRVFASAPSIVQAGLAPRLLQMANNVGAYGIFEDGSRLVWQEESLWPVAYSTFLNQLLAVIQLHKEAVQPRAQSGSRVGIDTLSEYPRQLPTRFHYAAASLGAWLGGAKNVQYFSFYATQPQIREEKINLQYASKIGYSPAEAAALHASGLIALPASLVSPLLHAQGPSDVAVFGSLPINEFSGANPPASSFWSSMGKEAALRHPGFFMDKYYRTPFQARTLEAHALYGAKDVLRDHYEAFYNSLGATPLVRCKHYCAPVIEVSSLAEIRAHTARIPIHSKEGLFFRGQTQFYALPRHPAIKTLLFGDSCSIEPSLTTAAARDASYTYDDAHFALKHFVEQKVLTQNISGRRADPGDWQRLSSSAACSLDYALLALAQHYGLPSHGLDVTLDEAIALWFATHRFAKDTNSFASYQKLQKHDWPSNRENWPVVFACQTVTHSTSQSLHDCQELTAFGVKAMRPERQKAKFFLGGHSDHQNRLAECLACIFRLRPGDYETAATFNDLFPTPAEDPAYRVMLEFSSAADFSPLGVQQVNRFHAD
jgi:hypothetical protein